MNLSVIAAQALQAGQRLAESLQVQPVVIKRPVLTVDPATRVETVTEEEVWRGNCRVQTYEPNPIERTSAGRPVTLQGDKLHLPIGAGVFEVGDLAYVEGLSRVYRVDGILYKTYATSLRLDVTMIVNSEVTSG